MVVKVEILGIKMVSVILAEEAINQVLAERTIFILKKLNEQPLEIQVPDTLMMKLERQI